MTRRERDRYNYEFGYLRDTVFPGETKADALRGIVQRVYDDVQQARGVPAIVPSAKGWPLQIRRPFVDRLRRRSDNR